MQPVEGGGGVRQMSTLHYNPYIVKVATKGGGGVKNFQKMATQFVYAPFGGILVCNVGM